MFNDELTDAQLEVVREALETIARERIEVRLSISGDELLSSLGMILASHHRDRLIHSDCFHSLLIALEKIIDRVSDHVAPDIRDVLRSSLETFESLTD
jgi:hypothetical protein